MEQSKLVRLFLLLTPAFAGGAVLLAQGGCGDDLGNFLNPPKSTKTVPHPIDLLLPKELKIHPFTGARTLDETGKTYGVEARVQALDAYGDPTKAFGRFTFMLYNVAPGSGQKGELISSWYENLNLSTMEKNAAHWEKHWQTYEFKLRLNPPLAHGQPCILVVNFESDFSPRLTAELKFAAG
ncbi:MAG: hypothetical protein HZA50_09085 [Planctomycetes bacterium]|nr:hypothetical protein [Planctomycetota bacterium]